MDGARMVDWELAKATAARVLPPGPKVSAAEAERAVAELRRHAAESRAHVAAFTGL